MTPRGFVHILIWAVVAALVLRAAVIETCMVASPSMRSTLEPGDFLLVSTIAYGARTPATIPFTRIALPRMTLPGLGRPARGDILLFELPAAAESAPDEPVLFVKRCIGIPGDTVEGRRGTVFVNGREFPFPSTSLWGRGDSLSFGPVTVPCAGQEVGTGLPLWQETIRSEGHRVERSADGAVTVDGVPAMTYRLQRDYYFVLGDNPGESLDSRSWGFVPAENILGKPILTFWSRNESASGPGLSGMLTSIRWNRIGRLVR